MHLEGLLNVLGHFGGHFSSLGAPYGLMLPLLGHLLASFLRSWGVLGRLFGPSWAKLSQDGEKNSIFAIAFRKLDQVGARKSRKIDVKSDVFFKCVSDIDFYQFLIDFGLRKSTFFWSVFQLKAKTWIL